jgi:mannose-1-phosphate guanylyltransferase
MKAVVLVGGQGTRLRPLTETMKKELLPLVDRAILHHTIDRLVRHGIHEVVMSSSYLEEAFAPFIDERRGDPKITWVTERTPLGTGGAIVSVLDHLGDDPFFALNGDICTDLDLSAMLAVHHARDATATIALHHVEDARAFGLVATATDGRIGAFREKPEEAVPGDVNAGTYILTPASLRRWRVDTELSIERDIFPVLIGDGVPVFGFDAHAYWMDLGTPEKYLQAHFDLLAGKVRDAEYAAPWIHGSAEVDLHAHVGRWVAVGAEARIGPESQVDDAVLHAGSAVAEGARVIRSIVGPGAHVGAGAVVVNCVLGAGARVPDGMSLTDAKIPTDAVAAP